MNITIDNKLDKQNGPIMQIITFVSYGEKEMALQENKVGAKKILLYNVGWLITSSKEMQRHVMQHYPINCDCS